MEDIYHITPEDLASGFLTPPPCEGRRDSLVSTQSSYCNSYASSEYSSAQADYSIHVPPPGRSSELAQDGYVEILPYEHVPSSQGLPWASQDLGGNDNVYDSFVMVPPSNAFTRSSFSYNGYPTSRMFDETLGQVGGGEKDSGESNRPHESMICWSGASHNRAHNGFALSHLNGQIPMSRPDDFQSSWNPMAVSSTGPLNTMPCTIVPSDSLMVDFQPMDTDALDPSRVENTQCSFVQTPQEVSFRRSASPVIKAEQVNDEKPQRMGTRMETRMIVRSTGAKGVKKEPGAGCSKKKTQNPKFKKHFVRSEGCDEMLEVKLELGIRRDNTTGLAYREGGGSPKYYVCTKCPKRFKRPEHRKRHLRTHNPVVAASCSICGKTFNRNDNCTSHYDTHIRKPGRKDGKNEKFSLREAARRIVDPKIYEKLCQKYGYVEESSELSN